MNLLKPNITQQGFTLLELMITIAIIGILAAIAIPSYQDYTRRAAYSEVVSQAAPYKVGVMSCYNLLGSLKGCNAGSNEIPAPVNNGKSLVANLSVTDGVITITPNDIKGITSEDSYILTPEPPADGNNAIIWKTSGGAVVKGYAQ